MKNFISFLLFFAFSFSVNAQTPQVPSGTPGRQQLPTPNIRPLAPADLSITNLTFVSIVFNADTKTYIVKVIATIKNNGEIQSLKTQVQAYTKTPSGSGSWNVMGEKGNVLAIDPGKSFSSVYSFKGSALDIGTVQFDFRLKVDPGEIVTESDETNNYSAVLVINPRAH